ncbi:ABC transporter substrate-binding protein [Bradyrhizobium sp. 38]|uniref:ABC transporter substrate-binding protein n=1 Tax=unclassified Bradyrhizobium TaxID=2631580 RepID=UPI001FFADF22|nr:MULTISPECIES: ABC transporter substrate-binding protein [unclassified Bradyrhizobium]MCK1334591.1 ABC transporter substrate-binding protein [Bradyrhizobium sp. 38]MCK1778167.1 ABC transporter substrate-binding protein [Bradyrhizobium sp. 132]
MSDTQELKKHEMVAADVLRAREAFRRGASRRDVMNLLVAAGMSLAAAGTFAMFAESAHAEAPRRGGRIKVGTNGSSATETLDPAKALTQTDFSRAFMFYNGLTTLDESLTPQLDLAEEIAPSDRATVWNIKLRRDVRFHDGSPLTSADVVYSLRRHKDPAVGSAMRTLVAPMEEIAATGPNELRIRLSGPNADLPTIFGNWQCVIVKDGVTDFRTANGTGPYKCQEFQPGVRSLAVRNTEYFKPGKPYLNEIELFGLTDDQARVNALLAGDMQFIGTISPRLVPRIISTSNLALFETKGGAYHDLVLRLDGVPGSNPDFVLALKHMFNREQIRRTVYRGYAVIANDQPIDPTNRFYDARLPQRAFDLDKARFHLQRSGLANQAFPIVVSPAAPNSEEMGQVLQQVGQQIGLNLQLQRVPADGYWSNHWAKHPIFFSSIPPKASVDLTFTQFFYSQGPFNESAWRNDRFDALLLEARAETDNERRRERYSEMQRLVHEGSGVCIPVFASYLDAHVTNLKGLRPIPTGGMMGYNFAENIWLDQ